MWCHDIKCCLSANDQHVHWLSERQLILMFKQNSLLHTPLPKPILISISHIWVINGSTTHLVSQAKNPELSWILPFFSSIPSLSLLPVNFTSTVSPIFANFPPPTTATVVKATHIIHLGHCNIITSLLLLLLRDHFLHNWVIIFLRRLDHSTTSLFFHHT